MTIHSCVSNRIDSKKNPRFGLIKSQSQRVTGIALINLRIYRNRMVTVVI
jgi:hypothetical protein